MPLLVAWRKHELITQVDCTPVTGRVTNATLAYGEGLQPGWRSMEGFLRGEQRVAGPEHRVQSGGREGGAEGAPGAGQQVCGDQACTLGFLEGQGRADLRTGSGLL